MSQRPLILVVTGGKGGVGKSFVSLGLAFMYRMIGKEVALIDGDLGLAKLHQTMVLAAFDEGDLKRHGLDAESYRRQLEGIKQGVEVSEFSEIHPEHMVRHPSGVRVLRGIRGAGMSEALHDDGSKRHFLQHVLDLENLDVVIIDTGAGIGPNVLFFNSLADYIFIITNPNPTAYTDAYGTMKSLYQNAEGTPPPFLLVMNHVYPDSRELVETYIDSLVGNYEKFVDSGSVPLIPLQEPRCIPAMEGGWEAVKRFLKMISHTALVNHGFDEEIFQPGTAGFKLRELAALTSALPLSERSCLEDYRI